MSPNRACARCGLSYPTGTYSVHRTLLNHIDGAREYNLAWGRTRRTTSERTTGMLDLLNRGFSRADISRTYGISRQRVTQVLLREGVRSRLGPRPKGTCFICSDTFSDWVSHQAGADHQSTLEMLVGRLEDYSKTSIEEKP